ncbi:glycosyltransferase [candidate division KSB1 bacterium]
MDVSVIIPVFNESEKIARDIHAAAEFLVKNGLPGEIIVVDDGSTDTTCETAKAVEISTEVSLNVIRYERHRGKGCAVRTGMLAAKGDYTVFADSGLCVPYDYALAGLKLIERGECDIAHGSRKLKDSAILRRHPLHRQLIPKVFRQIFIRYLGVPAELSDTQCGFKIYRGDAARKLYRQCVTDGFLFDVEIIIRAGKRGYRIKEFPVEWTADLDSRLSVLRHSAGVLRELMAIKRLMSAL